MQVVKECTVSDLFILFNGLCACGPAIDWVNEEYKKNPQVTPLEMFEKLTKLRRTDDELRYERQRKAEDPNYKTNPDTHTGWSWIAWMCQKLKIPCQNSSFSGMRGASNGPNADKVNYEDLYHAACVKYQELTQT